MQMTKISSILYDYHYVGDIIIAKPDSYIAFAGKR